MTALFRQIFPFWLDAATLRTVRARLRVQARKVATGTALDSSWEKYRALGRAEVEAALRSELSRREFFHRRAQAFLGTMAVMSAFTMGAIGLFRSGPHLVPVWLLAGTVAVALIFLAAGAVFALRIVAPDYLYDLNLQSRMSRDEPLSEDGRVDLALSLVQMNQAYNLIYATLSTRCYRCVRNGMSCLVLGLTLLFLDAVLIRLSM